LDGNTWALRHRPDPKFSKYNHLPSTKPSVHQIHCQLGDEDIAMIANLIIAGIPPQEIQTYIYQTLDTLITQQDIYNQAATTR
jgi:hypothetical protein